MSCLPWIIWCQRNDLVLNNMQWSVHKTWPVVWDTLQDYGRGQVETDSYASGKGDVDYHDNLNEFNSIKGHKGVKGLDVTRSNFVVTWKVRPIWALFRHSPRPPGVCWFSWGSFILIQVLQLFFQFVPKNKIKYLFIYVDQRWFRGESPFVVCSTNYLYINI